MNNINPFVELGNILNAKDTSLKKSSIDLVNFLMNSNFKFNINEKILSDVNIGSSWSSNFIKSKTNLFNILIFNNNFFDDNLIKNMINYGLKLDTEILNSNDEIINDLLFDTNSLTDEQNIYLLNIYLEQNNIDTFKNKCKKHSTLHRAVSQNKTLLIDFLVDKLGIDFSNIDNKSPIMFAKNIDTFNHLLNYSPNLKLKDIYNNDLSYYISLINDDNTKKDMLNLFLNNVNNSKDRNIDSDNNNENLERLNEVFINLVINDGTKKEISDFIKKNKLKNIHLLYNKENKTLAHSLIEKELFERFELFKNVDLYHIANDNSSILTTLLKKDRFSTSSKLDYASNIFLDILDNKQNINFEKTFQHLFDYAFNSYEINIPSWILKKTRVPYSLQMDKEDLFELLNIDKNKYDNLNLKIKSLGGGNYRENQIDLFFDLYTHNFTKYLSFNNLNFLDDIFTDYNNSYRFDNINFFKQMSFLKYYNKEDKQEFTISLFKDINIKLNNILNHNISLIYNEFDKEKQVNIVEDNYYKNIVIPFLKDLAFFENNDIIKLIDIDIVNNAIKRCDNNNVDLNMDKFMKIYTYLHLNDNIKDNKVKNNKNKI